MTTLAGIFFISQAIAAGILFVTAFTIFRITFNTILSFHFRSLREADKFSLFHTDSLAGTPGSHAAVLPYR